MDDWRLQGQERYLLNVALEFKTYLCRSGSDHDHCEFCYAKFSLDIPDALTAGFATADAYRWICAVCYSDFKHQFGWSTPPLLP